MTLISRRMPLFLAALGHGYAVAARKTETQRVIDEIRDASKHKYQSSYAVAAIYAGLGQTDQALEWLERACDERATWMIFLKVHPYFDNLHGEPRFQELLKRFQYVG